MFKVLVVYFTQTGQLGRIVRSVMAPFEEAEGVELVYEQLEPRKPYPFPWPIVSFFDQFPESVHRDGPELQPTAFDPDADYDLVVLGWQPWYLSPSPPTSAFLKSEAGRRALSGKPVVTIIGSRNMWLMGQKAVREMIVEAGGRLVANIALVDQGSPAATFVTTPLWLLTGFRKGVRGVLPPAGVAEHEIIGARRFGTPLLSALMEGRLGSGEVLLDPAEAAPVNPKYVVAEQRGWRSFFVWGWLVRLAGPQGRWLRVPLLAVYTVFLCAAICTVVPLTVLARLLLGFVPAYRRWIDRRVAFFERCGEPS